MFEDHFGIRWAILLWSSSCFLEIVDMFSFESENPASHHEYLISIERQISQYVSPASIFIIFLIAIKKLRKLPLHRRHESTNFSAKDWCWCVGRCDDARLWFFLVCSASSGQDATLATCPMGFDGEKRPGGQGSFVVVLVLGFGKICRGGFFFKVCDLW